MKYLISFLFGLALAFPGIAQYTSRDSTGKTYINFNSLDESLSCDSIQKLVKLYGSVDQIPDPDLRVYAIMGQLKCTVGMLNRLSETLKDTSIHKYQAQVLLEEDDKGNPRVLFNLLDLKTLTTARDYAKALVDFAPVLIAGRTGAVGDFLLQSGIATSFSKYTIDAYYEGAINNDPLIILYPAVIPAKKISRDVIRELRKNKMFNEVTHAWQQNMSGVVNPLAKLGQERFKEVVRGTENVTRETTKAAEKIMKVIKKQADLKLK